MSLLQKRRLGTSSLELSLLGLGGTPLGGLHRPISDADAVATVEAALASGVTYLDTAPFYGFGLAEHRLGQALRRLPREQVVVSTKVGRLLRPSPKGPTNRGPFAETLPFEAVFDYSYDGTMRSIEDSLQRLGLARIDIALIHDCNPRWHGDAYQRRFDEAMNGAYLALDELRRTGDVAAIGIGVNDCGVCMDFARAGQFECMMLAGRYTLLDQSALGELLPYCLEHAIGLLLAGPFNSGILATGATPDATFFYTPAEQPVVERTRAIEAVCARHSVPLAAAALQFSASHPAITSVVVGCRSVQEVEENTHLIKLPIPSALWQELEARDLIPPGSPG